MANGRRPQGFATPEGRERIRAADLAPSNPRTMPMQRMEDSNFRQVWRVTNLLLKIKR
jgi:hypothetical protein